MDKKKLNHVKNSCVGIGLVARDDIHILGILGSGFLINSQAYAMTANHVVSSCELNIQTYKERKIDAEIAVFLITQQGNYLRFNVLHYSTHWIVGIFPTKGYPGPQSSDIAIIIPKESAVNLPTVEIKTKRKCANCRRLMISVCVVILVETNRWILPKSMVYDLRH
jgi:hypothetical protein